MKRIDCHTHLQTKSLIDEYFANSSRAERERERESSIDYYAIAIKALDSLIGNGDDFYDAVKDYKNVFICECIDAFSDVSIERQLEKIEENLKKYQTIGVKIYLGYQPIFADDPKLFPVYKFCEKHSLSAVFHCGVGASNLYSDQSKNYASSAPIGRVAKMFPNVNFIASHFDWPNFDDCLKAITENPNVFTDISGEYENFENKPYSELIKMFVGQLSPHLKNYNKQEVAKKVMFGTDYFGEGSGFEAIEEYVQTLEILFGKEYEADYLFNTCARAYPKIKEYILKNKKVDEKNQ